MTAKTKPGAGVPWFMNDPQAAAGLGCRQPGVNAEWWFPPPVRGAAAKKLRGIGAKLICGKCPLRDDCLNWAIDTGNDHGIWGGFDEDQREQVRACRTGQCGHPVCVESTAA